MRILQWREYLISPVNIEIQGLSIQLSLYISRMITANIGGKKFLVSEEADNISINDEKFEADILEYRKGKFHILHNNISHRAEVIAHDPETKTFTLKVNSSVITVELKDKFDELLKQMGMDMSTQKKVNDIKAPMPGMVLNVMVESGQSIKKGDAIVVLEAMKMENILKSPADGIVKKIQVTRGDKVEKNQVMVNLV